MQMDEGSDATKNKNRPRKKTKTQLTQTKKLIGPN